MKSVIISLLLIIAQYGLPLGTTSLKYFPLKTGNVFGHKRTPNPVTFIRARILKDSVFNTHLYYFVDNYAHIGSGWYRVDSVRGSLMKYSLYPCPQYVNEVVVDSLAARTLGILSIPNCYSSYLSDTNESSVFGLVKQSKYFFVGGYHTAFSRRYVRDFGITYIMIITTSQQVTGCIRW